VRESEEILVMAERFEEAAATGYLPPVAEPLEALREAAELIGKAASGSWLGHQANVYFSDLAPPPPGDHFSVEWGLKGDALGRMGSRSGWREWTADAVRDRVRALAGSPDMSAATKASEKAVLILERAQSDLQSLIQLNQTLTTDAFAVRLCADFDKLEAMTTSDVIQALRPRGQVTSRDGVAASQGFWTPPHLQIWAEAAALSHNIGTCKQAADILRRLGSHLERREKTMVKAARIGTNVFIGHGRAGAWRELKDFVNDRLELPWDEFNRVPVAGMTNIARLSEMLDAAAIAFLVMTGEDETAEGGLQARQNVIHEAGLFQGRLGFSKAIVLLEDGCAEFSNIQGLGQIRFPKGRIGAAFEEVRLVLEREGLT
jgi:hypothetical protein